MDIHLGVPGILTFPDIQTPLGRRVYGGHLRGVGGTGFRRFRMYGMYCLVLLLGNTGGRFLDKLGTNRRLKAGDIIVLFPNIPHQYGPETGDSWEEVFIAFEGAAFDGWTAHGLDPAQPVWSLPQPEQWAARWFELLKPATCRSDSYHNAADIHSLLTDAIASRQANGTAPPWLESACQALAAGAAAPPLEEVARLSGVGYEKFRKTFKALEGESPRQYRNRMRATQATLMLQRTDLTLENIAKSLGYCDAFHFSKSFKAHHGCSPREFRRRNNETGGRRK